MIMTANLFLFYITYSLFIIYTLYKNIILWIKSTNYELKYKISIISYWLLINFSQYSYGFLLLI